MVKYSFIIPVKEMNDYIRESVPKILEMDRDDFEIIIYPDKINQEKWDKTRQIESPRSPAEKRNRAIKDAKGEILVFIDDDAYPEKNFLDILDHDFNDEKILAVGGPAITPPHNNFKQKVSGAVFLSKLSGGNPERYIPHGKKRFVDDWPSVNLSVRKNVFEELKGFDSKHWPGEDTKFCLDLLHHKKSRVFYDPKLIVYHHRREGLIRHLRQIGRYGLHRGYFAKKYPKTSFRLKYFIPSFFLIFVVAGGIASFYSDWALKSYITGLVLYLLALLKAASDIYKYEKDILVVLSSLYYIFFTHLFYGLRFIQGFVFTIELKSKLR